MDRVWEIEELRGGRLLMMLAIADHANDAGEAWPHQKTLAKKARLDDRQARRVEESLVADGYLTITKKVIEKRTRRVYKLFPQQPDKMSCVEKAGKMSGYNPGKMSADNGQNVRSNRTFSAYSTGHFLQGQPDILNTIPSHARSESPIEPKTEPLMNGVGSLDWAAILEELSTAPMLARKYLTGSRLEAAGISADDKPAYRVVVSAEHAHGIGWLAKQVAHTVKRSLQRDLCVSIDLEFVVAPEPQKEESPQ